GGFSGAINNIVFGITVDPISFWYLIPSFLIGLTVGSLAFMGWMSNFRRVLLLGLIVALVASLSSTPINVGLWEGQTGNVWGDALYAALVARGWPIWIASFLNSLVVDIPDKLLTVIVSYLIVRALPERITGLFVGGRREVERLGRNGRRKIPAAARCPGRDETAGAGPAAMTSMMKINGGDA